MVKVTYCLRRKAGLSWDEFSDYWRDRHAPLVAGHAEALRIRRYVQTRTVQDQRLHAALQQRNGGAPEPYDGIAELWFDDVKAFQHGRGDEAARQAARELLDDERRFIDLAASPMWVSEEWEVVDAGQGV